MGVGKKIPKSEMREYYPSGPRLYPNLKAEVIPSANSDNQTKKAKEKRDINPRPDNWKIIKAADVSGHLVVAIQYPNCINYEGHKILLFRSVTLIELVNQKFIDPHFSDSKDYISPVARFEPTEQGWQMALTCAKNMT